MREVLLLILLTMSRREAKFLSPVVSRWPHWRQTSPGAARQSRSTHANLGPAWRKADDTLRCSQAVPHPSTNRALRRLTSEVGRDPVYSTWYGRRRTLGPIASQNEIFLYELPLCVQVFVSCSSRKTACAQSNTRSIRASSLFKRWSYP